MRRTLNLILLLTSTIFLDLISATASTHMRVENYQPWANNVIALGNDTLGDQYVELRLARAPYAPVYNYHLKNTDSDCWSGAQGNLVGIPVPLTPLWTIEVEYENADAYTTYNNFAEEPLPLFINKNLPNVSLHPALFSHPFDGTTQNTTLSRTFGNQQEDYDFLLTKKNEILSEAGLNDASPDWEKVMAVAKYIIPGIVDGLGGLHSRKNAHPVDAFLHGSHCIGKANAMVAIAAMMGLPSRKINWYNHTDAEVLIDGRWRYVENYIGWLKRIPDWMEKGPLFSFSFQELITNPVAHGYNTKTHKNIGNYNVVDKHGRVRPPADFHLGIYRAGVYNNIQNESVRRESSGWHATSALALAALYGGQEVTYKGWTAANRMFLTPWRGMGTPWQQPWTNEPFTPEPDHRTGVQTMRINQDQVVRKPFFLSTLEGVTHVRSYLLIDPETSRNIPAHGGNWYYRVNNRKYYLRDHGGWQVESGFGLNEEVAEDHIWDYVRFEIPLEALSICGNDDECDDDDGYIPLCSNDGEDEDCECTKL